ncbi:unnamed protein product [marine sediment metagenome]|uniref:Uncharacterized protein n=1 Tax=marine sediment metagenome TaxID=412755 RepID=X1RK03_9ZZZZ
MTEELTGKDKLELADAIPVEGDKVLFDTCHLTVKDGHIVAECDTIKASEELAVLLMEDVFIRVKPKAPVVEQVPEPTQS